MKHKNLEVLKNCGMNVPPFIVVNNIKEYTPAMAFLLDSQKLYAVRSSFVSEDGEKKSFAGQFKTLLNVPKSSIASAINEVFESMTSRNVVDYGNATNALNFYGGCVIVQEMIDADYSGVIFTSNPQGILNETVIVVGNGIGENIVADKTYSTTYFYNLDDDIYYYEQHNRDGYKTPVLSEKLVKELIDISQTIKKIFSKDMDIEFAIKNDIIYILQARPITTIDFENIIILDNSNIVESYPGVSLPLTQDFVKKIYADIFANCIKRLTGSNSIVTSMRSTIDNMVDIANWRIYYRISNWYSVLHLLPFSRFIIPVWQNMMGVNNLSVTTSGNTKIPFKIKLNILTSFMHYMVYMPHYMDKLNDDFMTRFICYKNIVKNSNNIEALLKAYDDIRMDIMHDWDLTLFNDMYTFLYTHFAGKNQKKYLSGIQNIESMKPVIAINKLCDVVKQFGIDSDEYRLAEGEYLEQYGDRCLEELKLETQTYRVNPQKLHDYIKMHINDCEVIPSPCECNKKVNFFVKCARLGVKNRELSRMNRSKMFGLVREIFLKIGQSLVDNGSIEKNEDIFYLYLNELQTYSVDKNYKSVVEQRKHMSEYYSQYVPAYSRLVFSKQILNKENIKVYSCVQAGDGILYGKSTSAGNVVGEVVVITDVNQNIDTNNKIIVTRSTDPGWVFLIKNAKGIIAEKGSLLSHTAIISRELGKPAIVNVKDCTTILKDGDVVEINGDTGYIKILQKEGCL